MPTTALSQKDMGGQKVVNVGDPTAAQDVVTKAYADTQSAADRSRANHTGSQTWSTISDGPAQVKLISLDQFAVPAANVAWNAKKITGLADPTAAQDGATKAYVDAQVAGVAAGLSFKGAVKVAVNANVNLASPGATLDGVAMTAGDHFLAIAQTTGSQGGEYVWNGAAVAATRATTADTSAEMGPGSLWVVQQGTYDNQLVVLSNNAFVLGTDTPTFAFINPAAASDNDSSYTETNPTTAGGAAWAINHNLGNRNVHVSIYRTASPFDEPDVTITHDTANQVNVRPDVALVAGEWTAYISRIV